MLLKSILNLAILVLGGFCGMSQNISNDRRTSMNSSVEAKETYAIVEFTVCKKIDKTFMPSFFIQIGRIGVLINNEKGYSKFFLKKGEYTILVKAVGYKDVRMKRRKFLPNKNYKIQIELEER